MAQGIGRRAGDPGIYTGAHHQLWKGGYDFSLPLPAHNVEFSSPILFEKSQNLMRGSIDVFNVIQTGGFQVGNEEDFVAKLGEEECVVCLFRAAGSSRRSMNRVPTLEEASSITGVGIARGITTIPKIFPWGGIKRLFSSDSHTKSGRHWALIAKWKQISLSVLLRMGGVSALCLTGCATYQALFLNSSEVDKALKPAAGKALEIAVRDLKHPLLRPVRLDASDGLSPDEAAVLAVVLNPALRAVRDQNAEAEAQLLKAGILPNPQLTGSLDFVTGGTTAGTQTGGAYGLSWDLRSLLTRGQDVASARADVRAVRLDVAWEEWQTSLAARSAVYDLVALRAQVTQVTEITNRLANNSALVKKAEESHEMNLMDSAAVATSANDARAILLGLQQEAEQSRIALNRAIGYPPATQLRLQSDTSLPSRVDAPSESTLLHGLEERRLDLLALKRGYESQDAKLRSAILAQFPNIGIGFNRARDTGNVRTLGPSINIDLPLFDRNQGNIAIEGATRKRLFDEYTNRVFETRSDIASALADIHGLNAQIAQAEQALPALRHVVETSRKAVAEGNAEILGDYALQNDFTQKSIDILKLKQALAQARIALEIAAAWHLSP